ncbi:hypothetical protein N8800_01915 [Gammaproteobacteria bacterium]|jgi:hypothetical protein|nr:hypothetical protein [Gammaproteobacteria bacterium]MDA7690398.1 hypothetical protein [Gammaproteobacteria bacterium]MDC0467256.1 hypothetical protein [Gammaproteobacteria bacterium]MDC1007475.1 hypothetical protein [Gammaproteobacteria bacterium]MDC3225586.1 hypothetical protein [Gammaproteobacteria bacterium]
MKLANILSGILGLVLTIIAIRWILLPEESANSLGMILLDGSGRNTQIRDFTSIFASTAIFCFLSITTKQFQWIFSSGIIFSIIAIISIVASQLHEAPIAYSSLIAEIIFAMIAFTSAFLYKFR